MDFEKRMTGFFLHSVCLPEKVTGHFTSFVGQLLEFKCYGSKPWYVGLIKSGEKLVLQPGWRDFCTDNNVLPNDVLLFKFLGGTKFEVRIFDEIRNAVVGGNDIFMGKEGGVKVEEGSSSSRIEPATGENCISAETKNGEPNPGTRKRSSSQSQSFLPLKKRPKLSNLVHTQTQRAELLESEGENGSSVVEINESEKELEEYRREYLLVCEHQALLRMKMQQMDTETTTTDNSSQDTSDFVVHVDYDSDPRLWGSMTCEQRARCHHLALEVQTYKPAFLHVLKKTCSTKNSAVGVPKKFFDKHLLEETQTFVLQRPGKKENWSVKCYFRKSRRCMSIEGSSWLRFVKENNLHEGDIIMFELIDVETGTFLVHVSEAI